MAGIQKKTHIVLGAGASVEYGYPTGGQLYEIISGTTLDPRFQKCRQKAVTVVDGVLGSGKFEYFAKEVKRASFASIDDFLDTRQELADVGRYVLASIIISLESEEALYAPEATLYRKILNTFIWPHFTAEGGNELSLSTFNYDRSFEFFVLNALVARKRNEEEIRGFFNKYPIKHFHGVVGGNEWKFKIHYGKLEINRDNLITAQSTLRFQFDKIGKPAEPMSIENSDVVLIGFGFHNNNITKIHPEPWPSTTNVYATTLGISPKRLFALHTEWFNRLLNHGIQNLLGNQTPVSIDSGADLISKVFE